MKALCVISLLKRRICNISGTGKNINLKLSENIEAAVELNEKRLHASWLSKELSVISQEQITVVSRDFQGNLIWILN